MMINAGDDPISERLDVWQTSKRDSWDKTNDIVALRAKFEFSQINTPNFYQNKQIHENGVYFCTGVGKID
jgi:hypothetical protein